MVLFITPAIDNSLLESYAPWVDMAYDVLDEMVLCGNRVAAARKSELQELESIMDQTLTPSANRPPAYETYRRRAGIGESVNRNSGASFDAVRFTTSRTSELHQLQPPNEIMDQSTFDHESAADQLFMRVSNEPLQHHTQNDGYTAEQLLMVADSLDLDGIDWMMTGSSSATD